MAKKKNEWMTSTLDNSNDSYAQLEAETQVINLEELKLEKNMQLFSTLVASHPTNKVREQDKKLETLTCCFAKLGGRKKIQSKVREVVTKPGFNNNSYNPQESEENKMGNIMVIDNETDELPRPYDHQYKRKL